MVDVAIIRSDQDLKDIEVFWVHVLKINRAERARLSAGLTIKLGRGCNLKNTVGAPVIVKDFMFRKEEAVEAARVDEHLLDWLALEGVIVDLAGDLDEVWIGLRAFNLAFPDHTVSFGKDPDVPVLHLSKFEC